MKYLLLKHYRGAPAAVNNVPMDQWTPDEVEAHIQFMNDFATRLEGTGEFIDGQALAPDGAWVRSDGDGRPPVVDGPFAETKDLIAGWMIIDVDSYERAIELAGELSSAPGAGGEADPRMARGPAVPGRAAQLHALTVDDVELRELVPQSLERPRPSRSRLRDGRGRRAGSAHPGALRLGARAARRPRRRGSSRSRGERFST